MVGAAFYTCLLTLVVHCNAFKSSSQLRRSSLPRLSATEIVIFGPNNMRIHDNPCLLSTEGKSIIPVVFSPKNGDSGLQLAALSLTNKLKQMGANVVELSSDNKESLNEFSQFIQGLEIDTTTAGSHVSVTYCNSAVEPAASSIRGLVDHLSYESNVKCVGLWDEIVTFKDGEITTSNLHFDDFTEQYKPYSLDVPKPIMQQKTKFNKKISPMRIESITMEAENVPGTAQKCSEETALELLTEYLSIGDNAFTNKYASTYASIFSKSKEHEESISRLKSMISEVDNKTKGNNFFQGEILSAVLAPMLTLGCLSPRLLIHAKNTLLKEKKASSPEFPFVDRIRQEAVRRDWHQQLARASQPSVPLETKIQREIDLEDKGIWDVKYHNWRGYIQREGVMRGDNKQENRLKKKPLAFVLHGFGGSLDQFTSFAKSLSEEYTVISFDSLGFGYSEKPPLSYNQYLWRDQAVDYILRECKERGETGITLMGNSIGGFTVASVAAELSVLKDAGKSNVQCDGLVLMNSAGNIIDGVGLTNTPFPDLFPSYKGPPSEALRLFGTVMFSVLQPRIEQMLVWLYPSNPSVVKTGLAGGILRDSQDPGASDVIAAGGKLPTPRPMNDIFREYTGPVLIAQGALDPLNDAKSRANIFKGIRKGVTLDLLPLGHCPMDENPKMVAQSVIQWATNTGVVVRKPTISIASASQEVSGQI